MSASASNRCIILTPSELASIVARAVAEALATAPANDAPPAPAPSTPAIDTTGSAAEYLTTRQAADLLGLSVKGLEAMRAAGRGPKFVRIGHRVRYRRADLAR
jgi:hypothetical protein